MGFARQRAAAPDRTDRTARRRVSLAEKDEAQRFPSSSRADENVANEPQIIRRRISVPLTRCLSVSSGYGEIRVMATKCPFSWIQPRATSGGWPPYSRARRDRS